MKKPFAKNKNRKIETIRLNPVIIERSETLLSPRFRIPSGCFSFPLRPVAWFRPKPAVRPYDGSRRSRNRKKSRNRSPENAVVPVHGRNRNTDCCPTDDPVGVIGNVPVTGPTETAMTDFNRGSSRTRSRQPLSSRDVNENDDFPRTSVRQCRTVCPLFFANA